MRLFISHASEDKADFVRPLAEALRKHFQVWYDEYELTVGDSLLKKINEGLLSSDFGVVTLSRAFFRKKWPQSELDGLFALETESRKIILPVWKDVSVDEVRSFSPILAGRLAVNASEGIERVVDEIRRAVEVSNRAREINTVDPAVQITLRLDQTLKERSEGERLSGCEEGVALVKQGFTNVFAEMQLLLDRIGQSSEMLQFTTQCLLDQVPGPVFLVHSNQQVTLNAGLRGLSDNYTNKAELDCLIYRRDARHLSDESDSGTLSQMKFRPSFRTPKQVVWVETVNKIAYTAPQLASQLLLSLTTAIEAKSQRSQLGFV